MKSFSVETYKDAKKDFNAEDESLLLSLLRENNTQGYILDVGCGDGVLTGRVEEAFPSSLITGIDNSSEQIALALSKGFQISFQCADISTYNPKDKFDSIFSFYAFPHIPKSGLNEAFRSVRNILKKGGKFYLFTNICLFDTSLATKEDQEACDIMLWDSWSSQINLTSIEEIRRTFSQHNFVELSNRRLQTGARIKNYGEMISWVFVLT